MHEPNKIEILGDTVPGSGIVTEWVAGDEPPHVVAEQAAYLADVDDLLAHLAAHPDQQWVVYRWATRVAIGADPLALERECRERFPDGQFGVFPIFAAMKRRRDPAD